MTRSARFVSRSALNGQAHIAAVADWRRLIEAAKRHGDAVGEGRPVHRDELAIFAGLVIQTPRRAAFPVPWASAQASAEAFLILARAFVGCGSAASAPLGEFLAMGAETLDRMLHAEAATAARTWKRQLGEDDE